MTDLYNMLAPLHIGTKLIGLSPYVRIESRYSPSRFGVLVVFCVTSIHLMNGIIVFKDYEMVIENTFILIATWVRVVVNFFATLFIYAIEVKNQRAFPDILMRLEKIDASLKDLGVKIPYDRTRRQILGLIVVFYTFSILMIAFDFIVHWSWHETNTYWVHFTMLFFIPSVVNSGISCIYCTFICLVTQRFRILNNVVLMKISTIIKLQNHYVDCEANVDRLPLKLLIKSVKENHYNLTMLVRKFTSMYSIPLFFNILVSYIGIFNQTYFWCSRGLRKIEIKPLALIHEIIATLVSTGSLLRLIICSDQCMKEGHESAIILFRIATQIKDNGYIDLIRLVLLQISNMRIIITAGGLFEVNSMLLSPVINMIEEIIGSIVTYTMILIQFEMSPK